MNKFMTKIVSGVIGRKMRAAFGSVLQPTNSEFWSFWGAMTMKVLCFTVAPACAALTAVAGFIGFDSPDIFVASLFAYVAQRVVSKTAKA